MKSLVLEQLREVVSYARDHEDEFLQAVTDKSAAQQKQETAQKRKDLAQAQRRMAELDTLFQRIYEDNVAGKLTDERFNKLSSGYEAEQRNLVTRSAALQAELYEAQDKAAGVEQFMALVRKYTEIQELTPTIVNEFIRRIEIHAPDKSSGHRVQQVDIEYNFIGQPPTVIFVPQAKIA